MSQLGQQGLSPRARAQGPSSGQGIISRQGAERIIDMFNMTNEHVQMVLGMVFVIVILVSSKVAKQIVLIPYFNLLELLLGGGDYFRAGIGYACCILWNVIQRPSFWQPSGLTSLNGLHMLQRARQGEDQ